MPTTPTLRNPLAFVEHKHHKALSFLSLSISPPDELEFSQASRSLSLSTLRKNGWLWPDIFDEEFPAPAEGGAIYELAHIEYVRLSFVQTPSVHPSHLEANHIFSYLTPVRVLDPRQLRHTL
jgi:hypothetical protein